MTILSVLFFGLFSSHAFGTENVTELTSAIAGDPEVRNIVTLLEKSRSWKCAPLKAADVKAPTGNSSVYLADFQCKGQKFDPINVIEFGIDIMYVKDVKAYTTDMLSMEIKPQ
jgi:hypothetical protein